MIEENDTQKTDSEAVDPASAGSGGFCWCDMCGYVATLTDRMVDEWDHDHDDPQAAYHMCDLCEEQGMDSILQHGRHLPEHIIEDEPMREHSQNNTTNNNNTNMSELKIEIGSSALTPLLRKNKLWRSYVGPEAIEDLVRICAAPVPLRTGQLYGKPPSECKHMGRLRTHGFVELNKQTQHFEATESGKRWLAAVLELLKTWQEGRLA